MRLSLLAAALLLAGCGTSLPSKFYVLTADPAPPRFGAAAGSTVALGRVSLPGALDRPALARRRGGNEIVYAEEERWAGPDADETGAVTLAGRWEALAPNGRPLGPPRESTIVVPGTGRDAASIVSAMSRAVSDLAARIATGLR